MDPVSSTGYASRFAARLTGSTRVKTAFTLVELLIVIAILAVLAAAVVIVLNPAELLAQARDSQRITDLKTLKDAIDIFVVDNPSASLGTEETVYISLPDTSTTCANISLPALPAGWTYNCVTTANLRNTDGTGWVPLNLGSIFGGTPIPYLPLDPGNDAVTGHYYTYTMGGSYELTALLEAEKSFGMKDGGRYVELYEVGSDISLLPVSRDPSLVGYWTFEGTGSISNGQVSGLVDSSKNNNDGTADNINGSGMAFISGKDGSALQLDGIDDDVRISSSPVFDLATTDHSFAIWFKTSSPPIDSPGIILRRFSGGTPGAGYHISLSTAGKCILEMRTDSGDGPGPVSPLSYTDNNWHLYIVIVDVRTKMVKIYIDGVVVASDTYTGNLLNSTDTFYIGGSGTSYNFLGAVDDIRVYNRALSDTEIKSLYEAFK
jgi:type IV pilus assembly protein PilA